MEQLGQADKDHSLRQVSLNFKKFLLFYPLEIV